MNEQKTIMARKLAPEDIRQWMTVAVHGILDEWVLPYGECGGVEPRTVVARVRLLPTYGLEPLTVKAVCLPFVLVSSPNDGARMLDVRQHELVELPADFARKAMKALRVKERKGSDD